MDFSSLIPAFGNLAVTVLAFILALIPIVGIHEFGHYIVGRWSGIKADVFSIGAGPVLVSRTDRRGTKWQLAALPIGGYVKFHGDQNAASANADEGAMAQMDEAERRQTLHGAPLWARAATVAAGPLINFLFSAVIFTGLAFTTGVWTDPLTVAEAKPVPGVEGVLEPGDEILAIAGLPTPKLEEFGDYIDSLPNASPLDWTLGRDGSEVVVSTLHPYPPMVDYVMPQSAAFDAQLKVGDLIETVDGTPVSTFDDMKGLIEGGEGQTVALGINRGGEALELSLTPRRVDEPLPDGGYQTNWRIGIGGGLVFEPATSAPGIGTAIAAGYGAVKYIIGASLQGIYHMVAGNISSCNMRGVITIAETSGDVASQGVIAFIRFVAMLSTAIGLLNLFPIPVLDGGHLMFHAYEAIRGKAPSERIMSALTMIGLALVVGIMAFGLSNDIFCP